MGDNREYDIIERFGLPREQVSCPDCGQLYGHHNTRVCTNCERCSSCHKNSPSQGDAVSWNCRTPQFVDADTFVDTMAITANPRLLGE